MVTAKNVHVKAAAFEKIAERLAGTIYEKMESGLFNEGLATMLRKHGWTCTPPAAATPTTKPTARRKGRK